MNNFEKISKKNNPFGDNPFADRKAIKRARKQQRRAKTQRRNLFGGAS